MPSIRHLSSSVIAAIAAGEVVERPAIVVKELIENALDADATSITIGIENGGLSTIAVTDNGHGMDAADLELSIQRHTTSKIRRAEDLNSITSLGFRGEALASIAHVSHLIVQSRTAGATAGTQLISDQAATPEIQPVGMPVGTSVIVQNLFQSVPARLKFLKTPATEFRHIIDVVTTSVLSHPRVRYLLTHNQKLLLNLAQHDTAEERLVAVLNIDPQLFTSFDFDHPHIKLRGFVGKPQLARNQAKQFLFLNQRPVSHPAINQTIKEAFGSLIAPRMQPFFLLNIELPPGLVDINIHPRKETARFMDEAQILDLVKQAAERVLGKNDLIYQGVSPENSASKLRDGNPVYRTASPFTSSVLKTVVEPWKFAISPVDAEIMQIDQTYLVARTSGGLVLIDQHAAHERILYEQFLEGMKKADATSTENFALPAAAVLTLSLSDSQTLEDHLETFAKIGFGIEPFGTNTFKVTHVPALLKDRNPQRLITELLDDINQNRRLKNIDQIAHRTIAYLACRTAVKAGDALAQEQRRQLIEKLFATPNNATCPHGRPTMIKFSVGELEKMFRRR